jgi:hypothetical protein
MEHTESLFLLVVREKQEHVPLLTVHVVPV